MSDVPVSVVLTTYNHARFVAESLQAAVSQQWSALEVVVFDDGSTDDTWDIICDFVGRYDGPHTLVTHRQPANVGPGLNTLHAVQKARGRFHVRAHGDDLSAACIGVVPESSVPESSVPESSVPESSVPESSVPESSLPESSLPASLMPEAVLGGRADLSCLAIRRSMWTRLPGLRDVGIGLLGVFALRAALLRQCVSVAWDPPVPVSTPRVDDHLRGEARSALDVRELLAVLHYAHQHLPPRAAGPAVRVALDAVVSRLDPWVRHRQALYNQAHTTAWIAPLPDGTPVLPGLVAPREPGISGPSGPGGLQ